MRGLAKIQIGTGSLPRDCWVSDISDGGVRLHAESVAVPDEFILMLPGPNGGRRECRVVWRLGHEVGAEFVDVSRRALRGRSQTALIAAATTASRRLRSRNCRRTNRQNCW